MNNLFDKTDIAIDLTSLLDVIFIVLLIVMCSQKNMTADAVEQIEQAEVAASEARAAENEAEQITTLYQQHMEKYEETDRFVLFIDVTASITDPKTISERKIKAITGSSAADSEVYELDINPENDKGRYEELKSYLDGKINGYVTSKEDKRPIILTLNKGDDDILYRDEVAIETVFAQLREKYDFVY